MNTTGLEKMYDKLTPRERVPLIIAASARGDSVERQRLVSSTPVALFKVPNYRGTAEGLAKLADIFLGDMLGLSALYWQGWGLWQQATLCKYETEERLLVSVRLLASRLLVRAESWKLLCAELQIDTEILLKGMPGFETMQMTEEESRAMAFPPEEIVSVLKLAGVENPKPETAEEKVSEMRKFIDQHEAKWR